MKEKPNTNSKHAAGPWRYDRDNLNVYANGLLAQVYGHSHNGEREANARLIAVAPDMLALLKDCHDVLLSRGLAGGVTDATIMAIRKLVAKAEEDANESRIEA